MADHGIIVGIDTYPGISNLKGPCNDAEKFFEWLTDPAKGGADSGNVQMVRSSDFDTPNSVSDAHPACSELYQLFRPFAEKALEGTHHDGRLFLYVAGHGFADSQNPDSAALYSAEASIAFPVHLAMQAWASFARLHWVFDEVILISDACRDSLMLNQVVPPPLPVFPAHANASKVKHFEGYGAGYNQKAREREFDGVTRGIFTEAMMDALEKAKPNRLGRVTGSVIKAHIHNVISAKAGPVTIEPPDIRVNDDMDVLFIERQTTPGSETTFITGPEHRGHKLVIESWPDVDVAHAVIGAGHTVLPLKPGLYRARIVETGDKTTFEVPGNATVTL